MNKTELNYDELPDKFYALVYVYDKLAAVTITKNTGFDQFVAILSDDSHFNGRNIGDKLKDGFTFSWVLERIGLTKYVKTPLPIHSPDGDILAIFDSKEEMESFNPFEANIETNNVFGTQIMEIPKYSIVFESSSLYKPSRFVCCYENIKKMIIEGLNRKKYEGDTYFGECNDYGMKIGNHIVKIGCQYESLDIDLLSRLEKQYELVTRIVNHQKKYHEMPGNLKTQEDE